MTLDISLPVSGLWFPPKGKEATWEFLWQTDMLWLHIQMLMLMWGMSLTTSSVTEEWDGAQHRFLSWFLYLRTVCGMAAFPWKWWQVTSQSLPQLTMGLYLVRSTIRQHRCLARANVDFLGFHFLLEMERDSLPGASDRKGELPEAVSWGGYFTSSMAGVSTFKTFAWGASDGKGDRVSRYMEKCDRSSA